MYETTVISTEVPALPLGFPGVSVRVLHRGERTRAARSSSPGWPPVRSSPSTGTPRPTRRSSSSTGDFVEAGVTYGPGTFFFGKAGKPHGPHTSSTGCTVLTHFSHAADSTSMSSTDPRPISSDPSEPEGHRNLVDRRMSKEISKYSDDRTGRGRRPASPPHRRRRRRGRRPLRRVLHRQHPEREHPAGLSQERGHLPPLVRGARNHGPEARKPRRRRRLRRGASGRTLTSPRSSSTWPPSGCSSTGWSSARSFEINPAEAVRGPKHVVKKGKTPVLSAEDDPAAPRVASTVDGRRRASATGPSSPSWLYSFARDRGGARDGGRGLLPPGEAVVVPAPREGRQAPRDARPPQGRGATSTPTSRRRASKRHRRAPLFRTADRQDRSSSATNRMTRYAALADGPAAGEEGGHPDADLLPQLPGDRDHELPGERRDAREGPADGRPRVAEDDQALRPDATTRSRSTRSSGSRLVLPPPDTCISITAVRTAA